MLRGVQVAEDLTLEQVNLLPPLETGKPVIMTRYQDWKIGDFLTSVTDLNSDNAHGAARS